MKLGRDLVPFQVPAGLPLHPRLYDRYRSSIPSLVAFIERKEKTITPPFSTQVFLSTICTPLLPSCLVAQPAPCSLGRGVDAQGSYNPANLSVAFVLTSKIPGFVSLCCRSLFYLLTSNLSF